MMRFYIFSVLEVKEQCVKACFQLMQVVKTRKGNTSQMYMLTEAMTRGWLILILNRSRSFKGHVL